MLTRSYYAITWQFSGDLAIGATFDVEVGAVNSGRTYAPVVPFPYFAIDVFTDDVVEVDIETGFSEALLAPMATLVCAAALQHNTVYNLAPPFNRDGYLILTGNFCRIAVRNVTGNLVSPFTLNARAWR